MAVNINVANISGIRLDEQASDPSTPASGFGQLYAKADGLYFIGDDGVVEGPLVAYTAPADWTPAIVQGVSVTATITLAKYIKVGKIVTLWVSLSVTGSGTTANDIVITTASLPIAPSSVNLGVLGSFRIYDSNVGTIFVGSSLISTDGIFFQAHLETASVGTDPAFALASGDLVTFTAHYLVA